jgi:transposase
MEPIFKYPFGPRGLCWLSKQDFGFVDNIVRDELIARFQHYAAGIEGVNERLEKLEPLYPQVGALTVVHGIGRYTAMVIIGELGDVGRFHRAKQVASYAGLTARVNQSGEHCCHGHISKHGSP